jgi:uncharacterized protein with LGFP repeats
MHSATHLNALNKRFDMNQRPQSFLTRSPHFYALIALFTILAVAAQGLLAVRPALASDICTLLGDQWTCQREDSTTYQLDPEIADVWKHSQGLLGWPLGPETPVETGVSQQFETGSIWQSPTTGTHAVFDAISDTYNANGAGTGWLGFPTSDVIQSYTGVYQQFQRGSMWWSPTTGAHAVGGAIGETWRYHGTGNGWMGFPISDEYPTGNEYPYPGQRQDFQFGSILWSPTTGAWPIGGAIGAYHNTRGAYYSAIGVGYSDLGYPVGFEITVGTGVYQQFQYGSIWWSPTTGTHAVGWGIGEAWTATGTGAGWMGFPTSDEYQVANSGRRQDFQFGSILEGQHGIGAWPIGGAIGAHYNALGAQDSWLGLPISGEYAVGDSIQQDFQRGSIRWSAGQAATAVAR